MSPLSVAGSVATIMKGTVDGLAALFQAEIWINKGIEKYRVYRARRRTRTNTIHEVKPRQERMSEKRANGEKKTRNGEERDDGEGGEDEEEEERATRRRKRATRKRKRAARRRKGRRGEREWWEEEGEATRMRKGMTKREEESSSKFQNIFNL